MSGTIILDASFIVWLEHADAQQHYETTPGNSFTVWQGLDRLIEAGFHIVIPNKVLKETLFLTDNHHKLRSLGMGMEDGVPFLDPQQLSLARGRHDDHPRNNLGPWLANHYLNNRVGLYTTSSSFRAATAENTVPPIAIVSHKSPPPHNHSTLYRPFEIGKRPTYEERLQGMQDKRIQHGDDEAVDIVKAMQEVLPYRPVMALVHDREHSETLTEMNAIAGSLLDYYKLLKSIGVDEAKAEYFRMPKHWSGAFQYFCRDGMTANKPKRDLFIQQPEITRSHVERVATSATIEKTNERS